jgi:hypothetical protein
VRQENLKFEAYLDYIARPCSPFPQFFNKKYTSAQKIADFLKKEVGKKEERKLEKEDTAMGHKFHLAFGSRL